MQTIKSWEQFYADYPLTIDSSDYLKQVGHTIGGKSIEDYEFRIMVSQICSLFAAAYFHSQERTLPEKRFLLSCRCFRNE